MGLTNADSYRFTVMSDITQLMMFSKAGFSLRCEHYDSDQILHR